MNSFSLTHVLLYGALALVGVGLYGLLAQRNLIKLVVALQIMVKGTLLALVAAGYIRGQVAVSQSLALTVIVVDTIAAVVGLALAVQVRRQAGTLDVQALTKLKG
jgi:NADH:ubiquinone oxidoreductase subunit K